MQNYKVCLGDKYKKSSKTRTYERLIKTKKRPKLHVLLMPTRNVIILLLFELIVRRKLCCAPLRMLLEENSEKITVCTVYTKAVVRTPTALTVYFEDIEANVDKRVPHFFRI